MSLPPVPPRPQYSEAGPPPVPPLPPDFSPPHFEDPLAAPRPHRIDPSVPQNMARTLDDQLYVQQRRLSPGPPPPNVNHNPGFIMPAGPPPRQSSPLPPPAGAGWSPWLPAAQPYHHPHTANTPRPYTSPPPHTLSPPIPPMDVLSQSMSNMAVSSPPPMQRPPSAAPPTGPQPGGSLTAPLPTIPSLVSALGTVQQPAHDPALKIAWCRDVLFLVDRLNPSSASSQTFSTSGHTSTGPVNITDPQLRQLVDVAVPVVISISSDSATPTPSYVAEAIYLRATFASSGAYPEHVRQSPRNAFRDFESAARAGYHTAWFRLGRDYENFNDAQHARDCFERGIRYNVESCLYRMGMAHLLGQLGLSTSPETAIPLLVKAANLSSLTCPQPAYVLALILLGEFTASPIPIPQHLLPPLGEARKYLERSAYLHFSPAQYKLGHVYEFASPPFEFDPLLSVEWYSKASQQGEVEADMALSKWFLCGAEGAFDKDEGLAWVFADKAAKKGLPSAEFAMGYYCEVGIGGAASSVGGPNLPLAIEWYEKAAAHGNADAQERLRSLNAGSQLGRKEHEEIAESKLVRTRTQARQRTEQMQQAQGLPARPNQRRAGDGRIVEHIRKNTLTERPMQATPPPQQQPQARPPRQQQAHPAAQRYTLVDPGRTPSPQAQGAPVGGGMAGVGMAGVGSGQPTRPPIERIPSSSSAATTQQSQYKAQTFADMGIQGVKAEDKECKIM